jgi:DNA invertase Pin-like site-specific DNA recombinase
MRVALYARVSTADKNQNPETQLLPLQDYVQAQGWEVVGEYTDTASATDLRGRRGWATVLDLASKRGIDLILVWKLDRAFRSVAHMATTVEQLRRWGVSIRSYSEPWLDTSGSSPVADLMLNILASFAQFEKALIAERVRAGMNRAKREGKAIGRPRLVLPARWTEVRQRIETGAMSAREAARVLGIGRSTVLRLLERREAA